MLVRWREHVTFWAVVAGLVACGMYLGVIGARAAEQDVRRPDPTRRVVWGGTVVTINDIEAKLISMDEYPDGSIELRVPGWWYRTHDGTLLQLGKAHHIHVTEEYRQPGGWILRRHRVGDMWLKEAKPEMSGPVMLTFTRTGFNGKGLVG